MRTDKNKKFQILPKRWIVERTFAWFESYRRLGKDYEYCTDTVEAMIQLAMIKPKLRIKETIFISQSVKTLDFTVINRKNGLKNSNAVH